MVTVGECWLLTKEALLLAGMVGGGEVPTQGGGNFWGFWDLSFSVSFLHMAASDS